MFHAKYRWRRTVSGAMATCLMVWTTMPAWAESPSVQTPYLNAANTGKGADEVARELARLSESRELTAREMADLGMAQLLAGKAGMADQSFVQGMPRAATDAERGVLCAFRALALREQAMALKPKDPARQRLLRESLVVAKKGMQLAPENPAVATAAMGAASAVGDALEARAIGDHLARLNIKGEGADVCDFVVTPIVVIKVVAITAVFAMWMLASPTEKPDLLNAMVELTMSLIKEGL